MSITAKYQLLDTKGQFLYSNYMLATSLIIFFVSILGLWLGSELMVTAAVKISRKFNVSETLIGLTIVSIGTSFPEIIVAITGALKQTAGQETAGIVMGNVVGSGIAQIALILGFSGLMRVLLISRKEALSNGTMLILSTVFFFFLAKDGYISSQDGVLLLGFYLFYLLTLYKGIDKPKNKPAKKDKKINFPILAFKLLLGLGMLSLAAHFVLDKGILLATLLGVKPVLIGIFLVGVGTSLPELIVSVNAALKGSNGLSVGNLIGSNIVVLLLGVGASSFMGGWQISPKIIAFDLPYLILCSVVAVLFLISKQNLERKETFLILGLYAIYVFLKLQGL